LSAGRHPGYVSGVTRIEPLLGLTVALALVGASCVRVAGGPSDEAHGAEHLMVGASAENGASVGTDAGPAAAPSDGDDELPAITFRQPIPAALDDKSPAVKYADMGQAACKAEVKRRDLPIIPLKTAQKGVSGGMRIDGSMNGVKIVAPPSSTKFGILDCRLALVIDDLTKHLHERGVVRMSIDNMYRPHAKLPGRRKASQHAFGLAIDINGFELADGRVLTTADWGASIGEVPCGADAVMASPTAASIEIRNLVCSVARSGLFNTMLSPSYDAAHQSHFHFDIKSDTTRLTMR
jgi:hypothetical protein